VRQALLDYRWPGNVRELQNVFEAMFALSDNDWIDPALLPPQIAASEAQADPKEPVAMPPPAGRLEEMERQAVRAAISTAQGNLSMAARALGISRSTLYVKLAAIRQQAGSSSPH
jgi:transcriptional regulator of acetoin/glycerol metabolism